MGRIAIIDDDRFIRDMLAENCQLMGHETCSAGTLGEGKNLLATADVDLLFLDVRLPDGNGLDLLRSLKESASGPEVIIITGMGEADGAELAIRHGAWDYLQKPLLRQEITLQVARALEYRQKKQRLPSHVHLKRDPIIGTSPSLCKCLDQVAACAGTEATVLLTGDTGTGKELFARTIHANSTKAKLPFVVVDCATLPDKLVESILFGHIKGSFSGADRNQAGLIAQADGGTLFLDEVGELPLETQKSFLRVLQERTYRPVGSNVERAATFRLVAATNRDLPQMIASNHFRSDLYYRLNEFNIHLPSLRERKQDIEILVIHCIHDLCRKESLSIKGVEPETLEALLHYDWPGNVRELQHALTKAILADPAAPVLHMIHLPPEIRLARVQSRVADSLDRSNHKPPAPAVIPAGWIGTLPPFRDYRSHCLREIEGRYLQQLLQESGNNIAQACRLSGLSRSRLYDLLRTYSLLPLSRS